MIAAFLYRNPRILLLAIVVIVVAGVSSFLVMPRLEDPVLGRRVGLFSVAFPGADAQRVESLVTVPLEERLGGIANIKQLRTNSRTGIANIVIELQDEVTDVEPVWSIIRDRAAEAARDLPDGTIMSDLEIVPLKAFAAVIALGTDEAAEPRLSMLRRLGRELRNEILRLPGTEDVDLFGDPGEEYVAELDPLVLSSLGLSTGAIAQQIVGHRSDQPAGRLHGERAALPVELSSDPQPAAQIRQTLITYGQRGDSVPLSDIALIERRVSEPVSNRAIINGRPAIVLGAMVSDRLRVDHWADRLDDLLVDFRTRYGDAVEVEMLFSQREHIDRRMQTLYRNLAMGTAAVTLIVLLLMGWRSMLVVAMVLPLSALMVLAAMRALGIPVHQMSVTGLIVALGLLIDNAIVIIEDVRHRIVRGDSPLTAIRCGVSHLLMPLFGSTLTTALAFLPIATLPGPPGEFVGTIAISVILAISASFLLAMTVIPALISLLRIEPAQQGLLEYGFASAHLRGLYEKTLQSLFRVPVIVIILGAVLPGLGLLAARSLPEQFFPPSDRRQIQIELEQPARDSLANTQQTVNAVRTLVGEQDHVTRQHWFLGASAPTFYYNVVPRRRGTPFYAQAFVEVSADADISELVQTLQQTLNRQVPQSRIIVRQLEQGPPFDAPLEARIQGPDLGTLQQLGSELRLVLSQIANVTHTRSDLEETIPGLSLAIDDSAAQQAGLNRLQVSRQLYATLEGAPAGRVYDGGEELPVRVKAALGGRLKLARLAALPLQSLVRRPVAPPSGQASQAGMGSTPDARLGGLATTEPNSDVGAIVRIDGQRTNEVKAYIHAGVLPSVVMADFKRVLADSDFELPPGYTLQFGGETEQRTHAVNRLIANGVVLFALMLLTLVSTFRSFRCAMIVAGVGALSAALGPLTLSSCGYPFGFMAIVGTMGLVGVAINDSIVVLAAIRANERASAGDIEEMVRVVSGSTRHIVATTLTTIAGFLPLVIGGGGFWPPLAVTIAGGVGAATFLALYFAPSLYLLCCGKRRIAA